MNQSTQANLIKVAAVVTATPRWVGALLAAEGFIMPDGWLVWWVPLSALLSAGMALVEGLAFSYVFNAWRVQGDKKANKLLWLAILSGLIFIAVLAPFIAAQVRQETLEGVLGTGAGLWGWSASVAASTIVIVASVGYAQKDKPATKVKKVETVTKSDKQPAGPSEFACWCGWDEAKTRQGKASHARVHHREVREAPTAIEGLKRLRKLYPHAWTNGNEPVKIQEVVKWKGMKKK